MYCLPAIQITHTDTYVFVCLHMSTQTVVCYLPCALFSCYLVTYSVPCFLDFDSLGLSRLFWFFGLSVCFAIGNNVATSILRQMAPQMCVSDTVLRHGAFDHKSKMICRDSWGHSLAIGSGTTLLSSPGYWGWPPGSHIGFETSRTYNLRVDSDRLHHPVP